MKISISLLMALAFATTLSGCHKASTDDDASVGLSECDQLPKQMHDCMASKATADRLPQLDATFKAMRASMRAGIAMHDKDTVAAQCKVNLELINQTLLMRVVRIDGMHGAAPASLEKPSFRRKPETIAFASHWKSRRHWIPAFAGMTKRRVFRSASETWLISFIEPICVRLESLPCGDDLS